MIVLLSFLLAVLPVAIYPDLATPVDRWQNYWPGQPSPSPRYDPEHLPPPLRVEIALFKILVIPPSLLWWIAGGTPTCYHAVFITNGSSIGEACLRSQVPPFTLAVQHLRLALPFFLSVLIGGYVVLSFARRRFRTREGAV
jgi:hypothetical protein